MEQPHYKRCYRRKCFCFCKTRVWNVSFFCTLTPWCCAGSKLLWCELWEQLKPALSKHFLCYLDKPELSGTLGRFSKLGNTMFLWCLCVGLQTSLKVTSILERCLPPSCDFTLQTTTMPWAATASGVYSSFCLPLTCWPPSSPNQNLGLRHQICTHEQWRNSPPQVIHTFVDVYGWVSVTPTHTHI